MKILLLFKTMSKRRVSFDSNVKQQTFVRDPAELAEPPVGPKPAKEIMNVSIKGFYFQTKSQYL